MIDFRREEAELAAAVGLTSEAILAEVGTDLPQKLEMLRARYETYAAAPEPPMMQSERLRRDRIDSLLEELHGPNGLLSRTGALMAVRDRLFRIAALAPQCLSREDGCPALRREALIARTFARERAARGADPGIAQGAAGAAEAVCELDAFCADLRLGSEDQKVQWRALGLFGAADASGALKAERRTLADGVAFVLRRLADASYIQASTAQLDHLTREHAGRIRDALWNAAEAGYSHRPAPAKLSELLELDALLEVLRATLVDPRVAAVERCAAIAQLYALVASARAAEAATAADEALKPLKELVSQGIAAEA